MQENGDPEILKMLPSELAYRLKTSLNSAIIPMTKELPTIPYEEDLADAIQKLNEWGILTSENDDEAVLTPMGKQMSNYNFSFLTNHGFFVMKFRASKYQT